MPRNPDDPTPFPNIGVFGNHILINSTTDNEITKVLKTEDEKIRNKWLGILSHEADHKKKNDATWRIVADLTFPFVTHGSVKIIRNVLPIAKKARSFLGEQLIKIPTAFGKDAITGLSRASFYQYQEQRADNNIPNEIEKLIGLREFLKDVDDYQSNRIKKQFNVSDERAEKIGWIRNFLEPHPLPKKRIEKLDRRIELLKKQSEKNEEVLS